VGAVQKRMANSAGHTDRRTFIKRGLLSAGSLALAAGGAGADPSGAPARAAWRRGRVHRRDPSRAPNILVIVVDQMRAPVWLPPSIHSSSLLPNLSTLRRGAVSFERHYTAATDCTPSRGVLLTGLHPHQTGCMITGDSKLDPGFPTWGSLLREIGYTTTWWGKWHLNPDPSASLEPYGFSGGTFPSPNGSPGQGTAIDPSIAGQFESWLEQEGGNGPWCATVSFVNPHDIAWWYRFTSAIPAENAPPPLVDQMPPNFETPEALQAAGKPRLQRSLQDTAARSFGSVPFEGPEASGWWTGMMNTYLLLQRYADAQIGRVLDALAAQEKVHANTVVLFTSDHGEYGGSHGMRGKGASAYEEAIRVPLYVRDHRGMLAAAPGVPRNQLSSSADIVALLLTIATGSNAWRSERHLEHLAGRQDLAAICRHPGAPGRDWILHTTDEDVTEFASEPYAAEAPRHVVAIRTAKAKLATYSNWLPETTEADLRGREVELYDYSTSAGRAELENLAGASSLEEALFQALEEEAIPGELHAPLPSHLKVAQSRGLADYASVEEFQNLKVYVAHTPAAPAPEASPG
jgi:arylsulfatase A-like enzyme